MYFLWGIVAVTFVMLDALFAQLVFVYFSLGALFALFAGYAGFAALGQIGVFVIISVLFLMAFAPRIEGIIRRLQHDKSSSET